MVKGKVVKQPDAVHRFGDSVDQNSPQNQGRVTQKNLPFHSTSLDYTKKQRKSCTGGPNQKASQPY